MVKFNHSMFRRNSTNTQDLKVASLGWTNGSSKTGGKDGQPYNVIAIGSQDRTITVWTTASPRPLFVAKHFFSQSVVDLSWYVIPAMGKIFLFGSKIRYILLIRVLEFALCFHVLIFSPVTGPLMDIHCLRALWMGLWPLFTLMSMNLGIG